MEALLGTSGADHSLVASLLRCALPPCVGEGDEAGLAYLARRNGMGQSSDLAVAASSAWGAAYALVVLADLRLAKTRCAVGCVSDSKQEVGLSTACEDHLPQQQLSSSELLLLLQGCEGAGTVLPSDSIARCTAVSRLVQSAAPASPVAMSLCSERLAKMAVPGSELAAVAASQSALHLTPIAAVVMHRGVSWFDAAGPREHALRRLWEEEQNELRHRVANEDRTISQSASWHVRDAVVTASQNNVSVMKNPQRSPDLSVVQRANFLNREKGCLPRDKSRVKCIESSLRLKLCSAALRHISWREMKTESLTAEGWVALEQLCNSDITPNQFVGRLTLDAAHHAPSLHLALTIFI